MKSIKAKRIAAAAASLLMGLAVAGQVTFQSVPIINSLGQPVVQIVVGSHSAPSDGVVAANIAAVIGNLAYASTPITASVTNSSKAQVHCVVTTPTCTLSDQQVYLGERGLATPTGSYAIKTLIGSVLNGGAVNFNTLTYTKSLQGSGQYAYPEGNSPYPISSSPTSTSAFAGIGYLSVPTIVSASTNGGGVSFSTFSKYASSQYYDNVVQLSQSQIPGLLSNSGTYKESEYLWLTGFPVYDQASGVSNYALLDTNGAYQITFGNPIPTSTSNPPFTLAGANWTVYKFHVPTVSGSFPASNSFVIGGSLTLAKVSTPLQTVYVGHNITSGPFTVELQDLSYPNSGGTSSAAIAIYENGQIVNNTAVYPGNTATFNVSGTKLYVDVASTFPGLYAYQKWAKIQLFSTIENVSGTPGSNNNFPSMPGWLTELRWTTNQTTAPSTQAAFAANAELEGIVVYGNRTTSTTLTPGQTFAFPGNWKLTFAGDSLGAVSSGNSNYDPISFTTSQGTATYSNPAVTTNPYSAGADYGYNSVSGFISGSGQTTNVNATAITEPINIFSVKSSLANGFTISSSSSTLPSPTSSVSTVNYNLDAYQLIPENTVNTMTLTPSAAPNYGLYLEVQNNGVNGNYVSSSNPLQITVSGYSKSSTGTITKTSTPFTVTNSLGTAGSTNAMVQAGTAFANVTNIQLNTALPYPGVNVLVYDSANVLASLSSYNPASISPTSNAILAQQTSPAGSFTGATAPSNTVYVAYVFATYNGLTNTITKSQPGLSQNSINLGVTTNSISVAAITGIPSQYTNVYYYSGYTGTSNTMYFAGLTGVSSGSTSSFNVLGVNSLNTTLSSITVPSVSNSILLATLNYKGPVVYYPYSTYSYNVAVPTSSANVVYNGEGSQVYFNLNAQNPTGTSGDQQYFTYNIPEISNPGNPNTPNANVMIGIVNGTFLTSGPYIVNATNGKGNSFQYTSSTGSLVTASAGFRTERGSYIGPFSSPTSVSLSEAKSIDTLQFVVGNYNTSVNTSTVTTGPYGIGASILPNVTIANVTAKCTFSTTSCTVTGLNNLTATPTATQAITHVPLNTATTPLVVLDTNASSTATLISIGSGYTLSPGVYVNSVSQQIIAQNNVNFGPASVIASAEGSNRILIAGYTANETVQAGNQFIEQLISNAASGQ